MKNIAAYGYGLLGVRDVIEDQFGNLFQNFFQCDHIIIVQSPG